jgi:hypothetical protein
LPAYFILGGTDLEREFLGVWIPKSIYLNKDLTPTEKLLLAEVSSFAKNGICFASNEHFADFLGISKKHVSKLVSKLSKMGLITVDLIYKEGSLEVDKRTITPIRFETDTPPHLGVDPLLIQEDTPTPVSVDPPRTEAYYKEQYKIQSKEQDKIQVKDKNKYEREFEQLWANYPRKVGRKKAFDSFLKARKVKKVPYEVIESGLYRYIDYLKSLGTDEEFIQHGSTWFNQEKWQDEYETSHFDKKPKLNSFSQTMLGHMNNPDDFLSMLGVGETYEQGRNRKIIDIY